MYRSIKNTETEDSTKGMCLGLTTEKIKGVPKGTIAFGAWGN